VDIVTVLFDTSPEPAAPADPGERWLPRPLPSRAQMLGEALVERTTVPGEIVRSARAVVRGPRRVLESAREAAVGVGAMAWAGINAAPASPYNKPIGPHRRFTWVRAELAELKAIKNELGGTVNDVVLATVAGALGRHLRGSRRRGAHPDKRLRASDDHGPGLAPDGAAAVLQPRGDERARTAVPALPARP
jgi:hypothetical protein